MSLRRKDEAQMFTGRQEKYPRHLDSRVLVGLHERQELINFKSNDRCFDALGKRTQDVVTAVTGKGMCWTLALPLKIKC
ncbi:hypothetical protein DOTSEDRAFT_69556 [Dothistroma septosporum NZE10]|uniref:Uncharacterized protein n=1 Tax=Dothistroma septosporum (strain NZE10 / CBS 128990) TaxID=675120 RepID=N1PW87_DOTSN|nr:hypothetical protein DOTSEDRAFT_69556 [Dothistroma septosporum NZE10]